jgi:flagellar hook-associated protein 3 FlgL
MRFSFLQGFNQGIDNILRLQSATYKTQNQISTGQRILTPADDPVAAARILQVNQQQSQIDQYIDNINVVDDRLKLEETQLNAVTEILFRMEEIAIQSANGILSHSERKGLAQEVSLRLQELVDLANTRDVNNEYIFAGYKGGTKPFEANSSGGYDYFGDDGQRVVHVASSTTVAISDSGKDVFVDIPSHQNTMFTDVNPVNAGNASLSPGLISNQTSFDASSYPNDFVIEFNAGSNNFDVYTRAAYESAGAASFSVPSTGSPTTIDAEAAGGLGWEITVSGTPAGGDTFFVNSSNKQSLMTTIGKFEFGLRTLTDSPADKAVLDQLINDTLTNLSTGRESISTTTAKIGARQNVIESVLNLHEGVKLINQGILSDIRDLDYAEAISRLSAESFTLEAAQQSFSKLSQISLFNFLR